MIYQILYYLLLLNYIISLFIIIRLINNVDKNRKELIDLGIDKKSQRVILNLSILFAFIPYWSLISFIIIKIKTWKIK